MTKVDLDKKLVDEEAAKALLAEGKDEDKANNDKDVGEKGESDSKDDDKEASNKKAMPFKKGKDKAKDEKDDDEKDEKDDDNLKESEEVATEADSFLEGCAEIAKDSVEKMFEGAPELSAEFISKAVTIFEATYVSKLKEGVAAATAKIQATFDAKQAEEEATLSEKVEDFVQYGIKEWVASNEVALVSSSKANIAENFLTSLVGLLKEHNVFIPEEKIDLLDKAEADLAEAKNQVNVLTESVIAKDKEILANAKAKILSDVSEGLADTQSEKLKTLVEDIEAKDIGTYAEKVKIISESFFGKDGATSAPVKDLAEGEEIVVEADELETSNAKPEMDGKVSRYVDSAKRANASRGW